MNANLKISNHVAQGATLVELAFHVDAQFAALILRQRHGNNFNLIEHLGRQAFDGSAAATDTNAINAN